MQYYCIGHNPSILGGRPSTAHAFGTTTHILAFEVASSAALGLLELDIVYIWEDRVRVPHHSPVNALFQEPLLH